MGLDKLERYHQLELLKAIKNARKIGNPGFTEFEFEILDLVVSYCCYFQHKLPVPFPKFEKFKKSEHYYSELRKLVASKEKIRYKDVRLSSLIKDNCISESLRKIEQYDG